MPELSPAVVGSILLLAGCGEGKNDAWEREPETVALGRTVYVQHCAACHGAEGAGAERWQTPDSLGELPPPPHDATGHTWKHSDAMLYRIVSSGWRDPFNRTERLTMPAFAGALSPREIEAVVVYLKTLWTPEQRSFQRRESENQPFPDDFGSRPTNQEK